LPRVIPHAGTKSRTRPIKAWSSYQPHCRRWEPRAGFACPNRATTLPTASRASLSDVRSVPEPPWGLAPRLVEAAAPLRRRAEPGSTPNAPPVAAPPGHAEAAPLRAPAPEAFDDPDATKRGLYDLGFLELIREQLRIATGFRPTIGATSLSTFEVARDTSSPQMPGLPVRLERL